MVLAGRTMLNHPVLNTLELLCVHYFTVAHKQSYTDPDECSRRAAWRRFSRTSNSAYAGLYLESSAMKFHSSVQSSELII